MLVWIESYFLLITFQLTTRGGEFELLLIDLFVE